MRATAVAIGLASGSVYARLADRPRPWLTAPGRLRVQSRITGTLLIGAGFGLLLAGVRNAMVVELAECASLFRPTLAKVSVNKNLQ